MAERAIQITEGSARAMLKEAGLLLEFWDKAAKTDAYLRSRCADGPVVNREQISPEEA